jgi:hypothetical protein
MRRLQALLLLSALLTTPVGTLAVSIFPASDCCCSGHRCGAMCPMHRNHNSHSTSPKQSLGGAAPESESRCSISCNCNNEPEKVILIPALEAVLQPIQGVPVPQNVRGVATTIFVIGSSGFASLPEQPPRL